jgi:pyruvate formate lyase activating enzyme
MVSVIPEAHSGRPAHEHIHDALAGAIRGGSPAAGIRPATGIGSADGEGKRGHIMEEGLQARGVIFDLKKYAIHDGPGIRTTVFFKGCPLECWWCHNPEGRNPKPQAIGRKALKTRRYMRDPGREGTIGHEVTVGYLLGEISKDVIFYDQSGGGVTVSGGEPFMQLGFLLALLKACRDRRISTAVDTSGCVPWETIGEVLDLTDIFLYDIKLIDDDLHRKYTGVSNRLVLENLKRLVLSEAAVLPRIPLIPGVTDTDENIEGILSFLSGLDGIHEVSVLPYNKIAEDKFRRFDLPSRLGELFVQNEKELRGIGERFESSGYRVRYGG